LLAVVSRARCCTHEGDAIRCGGSGRDDAEISEQTEFDLVIPSHCTTSVHTLDQIKQILQA
jgi:hypothetical protein